MYKNKVYEAIKPFLKDENNFKYIYNDDINSFGFESIEKEFLIGVLKEQEVNVICKFDDERPVTDQCSFIDEITGFNYESIDKPYNRFDETEEIDKIKGFIGTQYDDSNQICFEDEEFERILLKDEIDHALTALSKREQDTIKMRFGLEDGKYKTIKETAAFLGYDSDTYTNKILLCGLQKLKKRLSLTKEVISSYAKVYNVLQALSETQQKILRIRHSIEFENNNSYKDIAKMLGIDSPSKVYDMAKDAYRKLSGVTGDKRKGGRSHRSIDQILKIIYSDRYKFENSRCK